MKRTVLAIICSLIALAGAPASADYDELIGVFIGGLELDDQDGDRCRPHQHPGRQVADHHRVSRARGSAQA